MMDSITEKAVGNTAQTLMDALDAKITALSQDEIKQHWFFKWDQQRSLEWNVYEFTQHLESHKMICETWESHHFGGVCIVERVRDKYVMPKICDFLLEVKKVIGTRNEARRFVNNGIGWGTLLKKINDGTKS